MCLAVPGKIVELNNDDAVIDYCSKKDSLKEKTSRIKLLFNEQVRVGDIASKHFDYCIEKIDFKDGRKELVDAFNSLYREKLNYLLPLSNVLIDRALEKLQ